MLLAGAILLSTRLHPHAHAGNYLAMPLLAYDFNFTGSDQKLYHLSDQLGSRAGEVQVAMITVDPQIDSPQVFQAYFRKIGGRILGLTGAPAAITETASHYGIFFHKLTAADGSTSIAKQSHYQPDT